jgi:hypothetical protein
LNASGTGLVGRIAFFTGFELQSVGAVVVFPIALMAPAINKKKIKRERFLSMSFDYAVKVVLSWSVRNHINM